MADAPVVHIGENSREEVAFKLFHIIRNHGGQQATERKWILDTYAECLKTVLYPKERLGG